MEIELFPDLSSCIHTTAKKEYEGTMKRLFESETENEELQEKVEMLRMFLESTDAIKLRNEYEPYLIEGKNVKFTLRPAGDRTEYWWEVIEK